jgi:hypothetical protein
LNKRVESFLSVGAMLIGLPLAALGIYAIIDAL